MLPGIGLQSVFLAISSYTQLLRINVSFFHFSTSKYKPNCQLKGGLSSVHFKVAFIKLQGAQY